jgi:arginyl-tRNA synthetase
VAAHGDLACTAAMQLAKPLKLNPRQLAEALRSALLATRRSSAGWRPSTSPGPASSTSASGPPPSSRCARSAGRRRTLSVFSPANGQKLMVEFVSANPTGPLHVGHGRQAALGDAICNLYATQGWDVTASSITTTPACRLPRWPRPPSCAPKGSSRVTPNGPRPPTTATTSRTSPTTSWPAKTVHADDREFTASGDVNDLDGIRQFAVAYLRHEQDLDLQAFQVKFDNYYLESSLYTSGKVDARCRSCRPPARPTSRTARCGCAPPTTATTRTA